MHKSSISSVEIATGMFMLLLNSLFLPMFCYLPFILRYFICVYFISFHFPFMRVTSMSFHYLFIFCSYPYPFIVPACHVQILTDRIFGMHDLGHHGGHNLYVWIWILKKTNIHSYKSIFFRVHIPFMPFILLSVSCQFPFTSFHVPSISVNHIFVLRSPYTISLLSFCSFNFFHVLLMFLWFPFPFVSFSFSSSFHVPFILLSCHFSFLPFFLQVIPFFLYVLSFFKIISNFRAYSFQIMFMVLGSFHDLPCSFMHRGANSLCDNVRQF